MALLRKKDDGYTGDTVTMTGVSLRYDDGPEILSDVSLTIPQRSFHFLTGPSGAGKTSLLSLMYLANRPSRGALTVFGENVTGASRSRLAVLRRRLGVVFQDFRLLYHMTAFDNVALPLRIAGVSETIVQRNVGELLNWVGLEDYKDAPPAVLSGGQKQRVAIARALMNRPDLIIADEPTGNLDRTSANQVLALMREVNQQDGATFLICTHDEGVAAKCSRRLTLEDGLLASNVAISPDR